MRIIQTYWPTKEVEAPNLLNHSAGWIHPIYHWFSWGLSCLQLSKYYESVTLYTNSIGKTFFEDYLRLPYKEINLLPVEINTYPSELWAIAKIYTYGLQKQPFVHVDGDVYIWDKFKINEKNCQLLAQNEEINSNYYAEIIPDIIKRFSYIPNEIIEQQRQVNKYNSCNLGITGGRDTNFYNKYSSLALSFVTRNLDIIRQNKIKDINTIFEQYLFYALARSEKKNITYLFDNSSIDIAYKGLASFENVPYKTKYIHTLADFKKNLDICRHLTKRLREDHSAYYYSVIDIFLQHNIEIPLSIYKNRLQFLKNSKPFGLTKIESSDAIDSYHLTRRLLSYLGWVDTGINPTKKVLRFLLKKKKDNVLLKKYLFDLFNYEDIKYKFSQKISFNIKDYKTVREQYRLIENVFNQSTSNILKSKIRLKDKVKIVESEWSWPLLKPNQDVIAQLQTPASFCQTALVPDILGLHIKEYPLTNLMIIIVDTIFNLCSLNTVVKIVAEYFDKEDIKSNNLAFNELIISEIKLLLHWEIIEVVYD